MQLELGFRINPRRVGAIPQFNEQGARLGEWELLEPTGSWTGSCVFGAGILRRRAQEDPLQYSCPSDVVIEAAFLGMNPSGSALLDMAVDPIRIKRLLDAMSFEGGLVRFDDVELRIGEICGLDPFVIPAWIACGSPCAVVRTRADFDFSQLWARDFL